jgi:hypothetical protein
MRNLPSGLVSGVCLVTLWAMLTKPKLPLCSLEAALETTVFYGGPCKGGITTTMMTCPTHDRHEVAHGVTDG